MAILRCGSLLTGAFEARRDNSPGLSDLHGTNLGSLHGLSSLSGLLAPLSIPTLSPLQGSPLPTFPTSVTGFQVPSPSSILLGYHVLFVARPALSQLLAKYSLIFP